MQDSPSHFSEAGASSQQPLWRLDRLPHVLRARGDAPAVAMVIEDTEEIWSAVRLADAIDGVAAGLAEAGLVAGDRVAILAPNSPAWLAAALGAARIGGVLAPADATASDEASEAFLTYAAPKWVFAASDRLELVKRAAPQATVFTLDADAQTKTAPGVETHGARAWRSLLDAPAIPWPDIDPKAPMTLFQTSGTTGAPKAFHLTHGNIGANVASVVASGLVDADDVVLAPLPLHHSYPLVVGALTSLTLGAKMVMPEGPTGPHILTAMRVTEPTVLAGVPRLYDAMMQGVENRIAGMKGVAGALIAGLRNAALWLHRKGASQLGAALLTPLRKKISPRLRLLVSGGSRLDPKTLAGLEAFGWEVRTGYGLSETGSIFTGNLKENRPGSEGKPIEGGEVRIDDPNEDGVGEILLRGPSVFSGYIDNPETNAAAFTEDGFFRTGDLGWLDEDGFLFVSGRVKEVIVLGGGKNIYPEEVEKAYAQHSHIAEIAVLEEAGALVALVVPDRAAIEASNMVDVRSAIRVALSGVGKTLPSTQRPTGFAITREPLPRTSLAKLRRFLLPSLYERAATGKGVVEAPLSEADKAYLAEPRRAAIWAFLEKKFPSQTLALDTSPQLDLGMDSFDWMTLAAELETTLGARITEADVAEIETLRDLVERVAQAGEDDPATVAAREKARVDEERKLWLAPQTISERGVGAVLFWLDWLLMKLVFRLRVSGAENIPRQGAVLICANHVSDLDPVAMIAALPGPVLRRARWAAARSRLFGSGWSRFVARSVRAFPVAERTASIALEHGLETLRRGEPLIWFPEGWRSADGKLMRFQAGVGKLVDAAAPVIVPAIIDGSYDAWPRERSRPILFPKRPVSVTFGAPVMASSLTVAPADGDRRYAAIAAALRDEVAALAAREGVNVRPNAETKAA